MRRFLLGLTLAVAVVLAVVVWLYPSNEDFRPENPFWNGLKGFVEQFNARSIDLPDGLPPEPEGTTLLLIPYVELTEAELGGLAGYVRSGGTLLLLDDYAYGNQVVEHLGLEPRFSQGALFDPLFNYKNKWLVRITDLTTTTVGEDVASIVLNHATSLDAVPETNVIARSSRFSFLDLNRNGTRDDEEPSGPLPVVAALPVDKGSVVLVADPSILINGMLQLEDNAAFVRSIMDIRHEERDLLLARSHLPEGSLDEAKGFLAAVRDRLSSPVAMSGLLVVTLVVTLGPLLRRTGAGVGRGGGE